MPCFHCHVVIKLPASHSAFMLGTKKTWPNKVKRRLGIPVESRAEANRRTAVRAGNARPDAWGKKYPQCVEDWQAIAFEAEQKRWKRGESVVCWSKCKEVKCEASKAHYYKWHSKNKERRRVYYLKRRGDKEWLAKRAQQRRDWDKANKEYKKQRQREWWAAFRANRPEEYKQRMRQMRKREASKPINRVISNVRKRLRDVMKGKRAALNVVGCTRKQLQGHLQSQFTKEMQWNNYGTYWHVDHIVPVSHFDLTNAEHVKLVHHYTNLRPMEAVANRLRGNKIDEPVQIHLPIV
jgi:hypothetical protein